MKIYVRSNSEHPSLNFKLDETIYWKDIDSEVYDDDKVYYESYIGSIILQGQKIGYVNLGLFYDEDDDVSIAYVKDIKIDEAYRNNGYGTFILKELSDKYNGILICPENSDAERLYNRIGERVSSPPDELESEFDEWGSIYLI